MTLKTRPFDAAKYLDTPRAIAAFLSEALETADPSFISHALGVVARARGMTQLARESGVPRATLYKALQDSGKPELATVLKVVQALGLHLVAEPTDAVGAYMAQSAEISALSAQSAMSQLVDSGSLNSWGSVSLSSIGVASGAGETIVFEAKDAASLALQALTDPTGLSADQIKRLGAAYARAASTESETQAETASI